MERGRGLTFDSAVWKSFTASWCIFIGSSSIFCCFTPPTHSLCVPHFKTESATKMAHIQKALQLIGPRQKLRVFLSNPRRVGVNAEMGTETTSGRQCLNLYARHIFFNGNKMHNMTRYVSIPCAAHTRTGRGRGWGGGKAVGYVGGRLLSTGCRDWKLSRLF